MTYLIDYQTVQPYITKDGSLIRELMHPSVIAGAKQSLAEATIQPGGKTILHQHRNCQEIYHITAGSGTMLLGNEKTAIKQGDTIYIPPLTPHRVTNTGSEELKILCCCVPPYSHEDTTLLDEKE